MPEPETEGALFGRAKQAPPPQIECDRAIPKHVIARYVPDAKSDWGKPYDNGEGSFITSCKLMEGGLRGGTVVRYTCGPRFADPQKSVPCVIELDEIGDGQLPDRSAFLAELEAALFAAVAEP